VTTPGSALIYFKTTYFTVDELASAFRVTPITLYHMIWSGELEALRIGKQFRVPYQAVRKSLGNPDGPYLTVTETGRHTPRTQIHRLPAGRPQRTGSSQVP
jgi:excisionase family DNA binding protein